jgi:hypothetical protein
VTVLGPIEGLVGEEAYRRRARHDEINELRALEAQDAVSTGDDEHDRYRTDKRP